MAPRLLFIPASGPRGSGEFYRSLTIARAARQRWSKAEIGMIVSREAGYVRGALVVDERIVIHVVDETPTRNTVEVNRVIAAQRPDVVIFDCAGRRAQLACARSLGARTVYISSRPTARRKGFGARRIRLLDQHWLAWPEFLGGGLGVWERLRMRAAPRLRVVQINVVFTPQEPSRAAAVLAAFNLRPGGYVLFCAGGGGYNVQGRPASDIFADAAARVARESGLAVVWVRGPNYQGPRIDLPGVVVIDSLDAASMVDVLAAARWATISGGSMLLQAIALHTPCVAAPVARDQPLRIGACVRRGLAVAAALDANALAAASLAMLEDGAAYAALCERLVALNLESGVEAAITALERLVADINEERSRQSR